MVRLRLSDRRDERRKRIAVSRTLVEKVPCFIDTFPYMPIRSDLHRVPIPIHPGLGELRFQTLKRGEQGHVFHKLRSLPKSLHSCFRDRDNQNECILQVVSSPFVRHLAARHVAAIVDLDEAFATVTNHEAIRLRLADLHLPCDRGVLIYEGQVRDSDLVFDLVQLAALAAAIDQFRAAGVTTLHEADYMDSAAASLLDEPATGFFDPRRQRSAGEEGRDLSGGGDVAAEEVVDSGVLGAPYSGRA